MIAQLIFLYFATVILGSAVVAIASPNLIYSALSLLVTFIHIAGVYVLLNAEFIAAVQIIVYAGAILVLYLFVLMLFNPKQEKRYLHGQLSVGLFLGGVILALMVLAASKSSILPERGTFTVGAVRAAGNTQSIGRVLFTDFVFPFEIASFILLVAMLGAIILARRSSGAQRKHILPTILETGDPSGIETPPPHDAGGEDRSLSLQARGAAK